MAGTKTAPKKTDPTNPQEAFLAAAQKDAENRQVANLAAHTATQAAIATLQTKLEEAMAEAAKANPVIQATIDAGYEPSAEQMDKMLDMVAERNPKLAKLMKKEEKSSDSDSKFLSNSEYLKAVKESGNEALIATAEFQGKMVHWKFWAHRNTRTLLIGVGAGVALTIAIPKLIAWARSEDATDADGDVVDFEVSDRLAG